MPFGYLGCFSPIGYEGSRELTFAVLSMMPDVRLLQGYEVGETTSQLFAKRGVCVEPTWISTVHPITGTTRVVCR